MILLFDVDVGKKSLLIAVQVRSAPIDNGPTRLGDRSLIWMLLLLRELFFGCFTLTLKTH